MEKNINIGSTSIWVSAYLQKFIGIGVQIESLLKWSENGFHIVIPFVQFSIIWYNTKNYE